jgi:hypothetical protein
MPSLVTFLSSGKMRVSVTEKARPSRSAPTTTVVPCVCVCVRVWVACFCACAYGYIIHSDACTHKLDMNASAPRGNRRWRSYFIIGAVLMAAAHTHIH